MSGPLVNYKTLSENLRALSPRLHKKHTKRAVDKAGKVIKLKARANAHSARDTGALSRALDHKTVMFRKGDGAACFIGPDRGYTEPARKGRRTKSGVIRPSDYAHIVEFGSSTSAAKPFLRPAMDSAKENAEGILANEMHAGLDEVASSLPSNP